MQNEAFRHGRTLRACVLRGSTRAEPSTTILDAKPGNGTGRTDGETLGVVHAALFENWEVLAVLDEACDDSRPRYSRDAHEALNEFAAHPVVLYASDDRRAESKVGRRQVAQGSDRERLAVLLQHQLAAQSLERGNEATDREWVALHRPLRDREAKRTARKGRSFDSRPQRLGKRRLREGLVREPDDEPRPRTVDGRKSVRPKQRLDHGKIERAGEVVSPDRGHERRRPMQCAIEPGVAHQNVVAFSLGDGSL